ncbi:hypothetical protein R1sor_024240 [Riccia sorocarpa]|uniref:Uncharacterized protein n=1 Tax=Riccia sorocarpa TaxID=122646 RepID=A0ABD3GSB4_9MARC
MAGIGRSNAHAPLVSQILHRIKNGGSSNSDSGSDSSGNRHAAANARSAPSQSNGVSGKVANTTSKGSARSGSSLNQSQGGSNPSADDSDDEFIPVKNQKRQLAKIDSPKAAVSKSRDNNVYAVLAVSDGEESETQEVFYKLGEAFVAAEPAKDKLPEDIDVVLKELQWK